MGVLKSHRKWIRDIQLGFWKQVYYELHPKFNGGEYCSQFWILYTTKELCDFIEAAYAQNINNTGVLELKKEIVGFKPRDLSIGNYYDLGPMAWVGAVYES